MKPEIDLVAEFASIVREFDARKVPYAICGGFAVVIHGHVRATKDIDLLVEPQSVEPAMSALKSIGFGLRAGPIPFGAGTTQERVLFRATKVVGGDHPTVDLLVVAPVFVEAWRSRETVAWNGATFAVVSRAGLGAMKALAGRKQDLADLEALGIEVEE